MTPFEFIFVLYSLLLGLSLVELLGGLGRALEYKFARDATGQAFAIGWLTPLLAVFVMLDLLSFWIFAWVVRDLITLSAATLLSVMAFASAYYLAARLVFPSEPDNFVDLDNHYLRVRKVVFGILIALVVAQWIYLVSIPQLREVATSPLSLGLTAMLLVLMGAAIWVRHKVVSAILIALLVARYLIGYLL